MLDDEDEWFSILEDRNLSVHMEPVLKRKKTGDDLKLVPTYNEYLAEEIYKRLYKHLKAMKNLLDRIKENM